MNDPGAAPLTILRSRRNDPHRAAVVLDDFTHLKLMIEARHRPFGRSTVHVEDVVKGLVHGAFRRDVGTGAAQTSMRMRGLEPPRVPRQMVSDGGTWSKAASGLSADLAEVREGAVVD
jgi:hypothetical protein